MKASSLVITELITKKLLQFSAIVDRLQNKDPYFIPVLDDWMKEIESLFKDHNIAESAEIAGLRSKIIAPLFGEESRIAAKKKQLKIASEVLYDLQHAVLSVMKPHELKVNESRDILNQLLGILKQTGAVKYQVGSDFQDFINKIWGVFSTHEQLKASAIKILTLISQADAVRIIAEEIELNEWI